MTEQNKKRIYLAATELCLRAVCGWDAEIDGDNFDLIVDEELISVIDELYQPVWKPTEEQIRRLESLVNRVEGDYDDDICEQILINVKKLSEL